MKPIHRVALAACTLSLAACGGSEPASEVSPPVASAPSSAPAPAPAPSPSAAPAPAPAPLPAAALTACNLPRPAGTPAWSAPVDPFARWEANAQIEPTAGNFEFAFDLAPPPANAGRMALLFRADCTGMAVASGNNNGTPDGWGVLGTRWTASGQRWEAGIVAGLRREPPAAEYGVRLVVTGSEQFVAAQVDGDAGQLRLARYRGIRDDQIEPGPWDVEPVDRWRLPRRLLDLVAGPGGDQATLAYAQPVAGDLVLQSISAVTLDPSATALLRYPPSGEPRSGTLAFDGIGRAFIAWQQSATAGGARSHFRAWAASIPGGFAGGAEALGANLDSLQLVGNRGGGALMAWRDLSTSELLASRFCPVAGCWHPPVSLGANPQPASALVARAGQVYQAVWAVSDNDGQPRLAVQQLPPDGSPAPGAPSLSPPLEEGAATMLRAFAAAEGGLWVVHGNASAVGLAHWSAGSGWRMIASFGGGSGVALPTLRAVAGADGSVHVLWQRAGGDNAGWRYMRGAQQGANFIFDGSEMPVMSATRGEAELAVSPDGTAWVMFARPVVLDAGLPSQRTVYRAAISYRVPTS